MSTNDDRLLDTSASTAHTTPIETADSVETAEMAADTATVAGTPAPTAHAVPTAPVTPVTPVAPVAPEYRSGPAVVPIIVGLFGLLVAGLVLIQTATDIRLDWAKVGPVSIVVGGIVLMGLGLLGMRNRSREGAAQDA